MKSLFTYQLFYLLSIWIWSMKFSIFVYNIHLQDKKFWIYIAFYKIIKKETLIDLKILYTYICTLLLLCNTSLLKDTPTDFIFLKAYCLQIVRLDYIFSMWRDSNSHLLLRRQLSYPLDYTHRCLYE